MTISVPGTGRRAVAALAVVAAALAGCAGGSKGPLADATPTDREFVAAATTWDLDKNGDITCDEWKRYAASLFREADANRDGVLTREEFAVMARRDRLFEGVGLPYFDANADGRLTLAEVVDKPNPAFSLLDTNKDCVLTPEERRHQRSPSATKDSPETSAQPPTLPPRPGPRR
jgi:predicted small lipoprotein YifL